MSIVKKISRRRFLSNTAGYSLAIPFLPSIMGKAYAAAGTPPKRFIAIFSSNGQRRDQLYPTTSPAWNVRATGNGNWTRDFPLANLPVGQISKVFGPEFNSLRNKMLLIRGLDL